MGKQSAVSREARLYIMDKAKEEGLCTVDEVSEIVAKHYQFDPERSKQKEILAYSRRLLASIKTSTGDRMLLSVKGDPGKFVDIDHCRDVYDARMVKEQLTDKRDGLNRNIAKADRRIQELEGQITISDLVRAAQ